MHDADARSLNPAIPCAGLEPGLWAGSWPKRAASAAAAIRHALHHGSPRAQGQAQPQERNLPQRSWCSLAHPLSSQVMKCFVLQWNAWTPLLNARNGLEPVAVMPESTVCVCYNSAKSCNSLVKHVIEPADRGHMSRRDVIDASFDDSG